VQANLGSLDEPCEWHNRLDLVRCGGRMTEHELMTLLSRARKVLDRYLFEDDGETIRDDVAEVCWPSMT
jgi:hypothetical protein